MNKLKWPWWIAKILIAGATVAALIIDMGGSLPRWAVFLVQLALVSISVLALVGFGGVVALWKKAPIPPAEPETETWQSVVIGLVLLFGPILVLFAVVWRLSDSSALAGVVGGLWLAGWILHFLLDRLGELVSYVWQHRALLTKR